MKKTVFIIISLCIAVMLKAQVNKTINVTSGGLSSALTSNELSTITNLTVTGTIDARDFKTMRDNMPDLAIIDLSSVVIIAYFGTQGTYSPNSKTYHANAVPDYAFCNPTGPTGKTSLTSITVPASVTSVGVYAFAYCSSLTSVIIPPSVTFIGNLAFYKCSSLASIILPSSLISIERSTFFSCSSLTFVTIPSSVISIGSGAFSYCSGLTSVIIPSSVTSIDVNAFSNCVSLSTVNIPPSVTFIGNRAFSYCSSLISVYLSSSLTSIGDAVFENCSSLSSVNIPPSVKSIGVLAFAHDSSLVSVILPSSLTSIGDYAFYNCKSLASINLPPSLISIGEIAFAQCSSLTSVTIPSLVTTIKNGAFSLCSALISVDANNSNYSSIDGVLFNKAQTTLILCPISKTGNYIIPSTVTSIGESAFSSCTGLTSVTIPLSVTSIGSRAFDSCSGLSSVTIPSSVTSIGVYAFSLCSALISVDSKNLNYSAIDGVLFNRIQTTLILCPISKTGSYTIPSSVITIGDYAFSSCTGLTSVIIPPSVTTIGLSAFNDCTGLTSVTIPSSVTSIGKDAFNHCNVLISVDSKNPNYSSVDGVLFNKTQTTLIRCPISKKGSYIIPSSVTSIGEGAFISCTGLTSVIIPSSVTSIGPNAFNNCSNLATVTIPTSVNSIGNSAFFYCTGLRSIYLYSVIPIDLSSSSNVFFNVNKTTCKLYVPVGSKRAYQNAVTWKDFLNILELMNLELFPGQSFSTWGYCWSNNGPLSGSIKEDPEVDWGDVSPKNFTSNSCTDIVPVQFAIKAPLKEGVYKTTLIDQSGIWPNAGIILNVTNSPQNFTAIRFGIYDDSITCRTRINYLPFNMNQVNNSCVSDYFPGNTITFGTKINPDVNWLKINPLSGTLTKNEWRDIQFTLRKVKYDSTWIIQEKKYFSFPKCFKLITKEITPRQCVLQFNGTNNYISTNYYPSKNTRTLMYWVRFNEISDQAIGVHDGENHKFYLGIIKSNSLFAGIGDSYAPAITLNLIPEKWYHLALTANSDSATIYINGTQVSKFPYAFSGTSKADFTIGVINAYSAYGAYINGLIDEVQVWERPLTRNEIIQYMFDPPKGNENGLVVYYPFNEGWGDFTKNSVNNLYSGILSNQPVWIDNITRPSEGVLSGKEIAFGKWEEFFISKQTPMNIWVNVPENKQDLIVLLKKASHIGYSDTWYGSIKLMKNDSVIRYIKNTEDFNIQLKNPKPGRYDIELWSDNSGDGLIKVCSAVDTLRLGEWKIGEVLRPYGCDWMQVDVPANQLNLYFETEGIGMWSTLDVFYNSLENNNGHWHFDNLDEGYHIDGKIPNPKAGRYYLKYMDSGVLQGIASQNRQYLINANTQPIINPAPLQPIITGLSTYEVGQGPVTIEVYGTGLDTTLNLAMVRSGYDTLYCESIFESDNLTSLLASFDFTNTDTGVFRLIIIKVDKSIIYSQPIKICNTKYSQLSVEIMGRTQIRVGNESNYKIKITNNGNIDCYNRFLVVEIVDDIISQSEKLKSNYGNGFQEPLQDASLYKVVYLPQIFPKLSEDILLNIILREEKCIKIYTTTRKTEDVKCEFWKKAIENLTVDWQKYDYLLNAIKTELQKEKCDCNYERQTYPLCYKLCYQYQEYQKAFDETIKKLSNLCILWPIDCDVENRPSICKNFTSKKGYIGFGDEKRYHLAKKLFVLDDSISDNKTISICSVSSTTPEDKYGITGFDSPEKAITGLSRYVYMGEAFTYRIDFWNKETATAPAQQVFIKDTLDIDLNDTTLNFTEIGFLRWKTKLDGGQYFNVNVDMRPDMDLIVNAKGKYNPDSREISYTFISLDPKTMELTEDPMAGFLPPIDTSGYQIGWVEYEIEPKKNLSTGAKITNRAWVNFDDVGPTNPAPKEGPWLNTIDAEAPLSYLNPNFTLLDSTAYHISWAGADDQNGSGIKYFTIYVSDNNGKYYPWLRKTADTTGVFVGVTGHTYRFYSSSTDNAGNVEPAHSSFDAMLEIATTMAGKIKEGRDELFIYPNPANDLLYIKDNLGFPKRIRVYSINGQILLEKLLTYENYIDISKLLHGIYIVKIDTPETSISKKLIKQ